MALAELFGKLFSSYTDALAFAFPLAFSSIMKNILYICIHKLSDEKNCNNIFCFSLCGFYFRCSME